MTFSFNLCLPGSASNIVTVHINTTRNRRARRRLVVLKRCSLLGNSGSRMGIWLNWAEHMSPVFMLDSISTNTTDPGQHPRAKSLLLATPKCKCNNSLKEYCIVEMLETESWLWAKHLKCNMEWKSLPLHCALGRPTLLSGIAGVRTGLFYSADNISCELNAWFALKIYGTHWSLKVELKISGKCLLNHPSTDD